MIKYTDGHQVWHALKTVLKRERDHLEFIVSCDGFGFHIVIGSYTHGRYLCMPGLGFITCLSGLNDPEIDRRVISRRFSARDTEFIMKALEEEYYNR
jgi:hypothetical protein